MDKFMISFINDEVSTDIDESINFAIKNHINYIEIRSVNGVNVLDLNESQILTISQKLKDKKIGVSAISSPLFKWESNLYNIDTSDNIDKFGFKIHLTDSEKLNYINTAIKFCNIFNTKNLRVFSLLRSINSESQEFFAKENHLYDFLSKEALKNGITILLENEPTCNFRSISQLLDFNKLFPIQDAKLLLDIGNVYQNGEILSSSLLSELSKNIGYMHVKDFSIVNRKYVPIGDGDIPYKEFIKKLNICLQYPIYVSLETHSTANKSVDSQKSIDMLKKIFYFLYKNP